MLIKRRRIIEKMGKREVEEERRPSTNFKEVACCPSAIVQRAARKKMVCARGVPGVAGTFGKANSYFDPSETGSGACTTTLRQLLIGADCKVFETAIAHTRRREQHKQ